MKCLCGFESEYAKLVSNGKAICPADIQPLALADGVFASFESHFFCPECGLMYSNIGQFDSLHTLAAYK